MPEPDFNELLADSACLTCLEPGQLSYIKTSMLVDWANSATPDPEPPAFSPEDAGTPFLWYDAGSYALADGATIGVANPWVDQSGNSDATTTVGNEPVFKTNIFGIKPAVRLVGTKQLLFDIGELSFNDFTFLAVVRAYGDSVWLSRTGLNRQVRVTRLGVNNLSYYPGSGAEILAPLSQPATDAKMIGYRNNTSEVGGTQFFENAVNIAGGSNGAVLNINKIGIIDGAPLNIDIGELVIYDAVIPTADVQSLYNLYFKPKFGLP